MLAAVETTCNPKTWEVEVEARIRNSRSLSLRPSALHETLSQNFFSKAVIYQEGQLLVVRYHAMALSFKSTINHYFS